MIDRCHFTNIFRGYPLMDNRRFDGNWRTKHGYGGGIGADPQGPNLPINISQFNSDSMFVKKDTDYSNRASAKMVSCLQMYFMN